MSKLILDRGNFSDVTSVSNYFIDEYMPKASGEFVKIYLHLLRMVASNATELSTDNIADVLNFTENDVLRGLNYWESLGLLSLARDNSENICSVRLEPLTTSRFYVKNLINNMDTQMLAKASGDNILSPAYGTPVVAENNPNNVLPAKRKYTAKEISAFGKDDRVQQLIFLAQTYLGKTLNSSDVNSILYMLDGLSLSSDFIEYIMEMCISSGNKSLSAIEKSAVSFYKRNITSIDDAKTDEKLRKSIYKSVFKIFGISDKPTAKRDISYISKWSEEYKFSEEIIIEACNRTIAHTHSASFPYADSILTKWHHKGITTFEEIEALDKEHTVENEKKYSAFKGQAAENISSTKKGIGVKSAKTRKSNDSESLKKFKNMNERTYDMDELEKMLLGVNNK